MAVVNAVKAGQVARRFRRGDDVVRRHREVTVRQRQFLHGCAQPLVDTKRFAQGLFHLAVQPLAEVLADDADRQGSKRLIQGLDIVRHRAVDAGAVARIVTRDHSEQQSDIGDATAEGPDLVE